MELHTSETISDTTNSSTNNELSLSFDIANGGTETVYVDDKLLTNYDVAKARAESIFLDEGYVTKRVTFSTYHIDNLHIGDTIQLDGLLFKVINIVDKIKGAVVSMDITAERAGGQSAPYIISVYFVTATQVNDAVSHTDGYMYAVADQSGSIYRSNNGEIWVEVFNSGKDNGYLITSHTDGYVYASINSYTVGGSLYRSNNGTTWVDVLTPFSASISASHSDGYLYISEDGYNIYRSNNGTNWAISYTDTEYIFSLCSHNGYLYKSTSAGSGVYKLYKSIDGIVWTEMQSGGQALSGLYSAGIYLYSLSSDKIYRTVDGTTIDTVFTSNDFGFDKMTKTSVGTLWVPNANNVLTSIDGITWEIAYSADISVWFYQVCYHNGSIYCFDDLGNVYKISNN